MVVLGVVEGRRCDDLGRETTVPCVPERFLVALRRRQRRLVLRIVEVVDAGAVLRSDVVPLPHALRRVVAFPEHLEELVVRHFGWPVHDQHDLVVPGQPGADFLVGNLPGVVDDEHHLGVPGEPGADFLVGGVRRASGRVTDGRGEDPHLLPELSFGSPEAPKPKHRLLRVFGKRAAQRGVQYEMLPGDRHFCVTARERLLGRWHTKLLLGREKHVSYIENGRPTGSAPGRRLASLAIIR